MKNKVGSRIKIVHVYILFALIIIVIAGFIIYGSIRAEKSIRDMQEYTVEYAEGQNAINDLMAASDYLTKQARVFVVTGHEQNGLNYQEEVDVTRRRDKALATLKEFGVRQEAYDALESALRKSNALMETEYYAMRLAAEGYGIKKSDYEAFTLDAKLTEEDKKLTPEQQIRKSIDIMFGEEYDSKKTKIRESVATSLDELIGELEERQVESFRTADSFSRNERDMFFFALFGMIILMILTGVLVLAPIRKSTIKIQNHEPLPMKGSYEFYQLANAYNEMLETSTRHQKELSYEATHDQLTGLYNRKMFDEQKNMLGDEKVAMLIIDVDHFKEVNDTYGHDTGDMVLKKVGAALSASFRLEDYVCRIGGDEFAVIMRQTDSSLKQVVRDKINRVQEKLLLRDDLPRATLSIGVAFSDDKGPEENIFKKADKALYSIKENGRDGYAFYGDM